MFSLANKIAVVTGCASGIGDAVVRRFLKAGATVYSIDLVDSVAEDATELVGDVSKEADIERFLAEAATPRGKTDILVNNAGIQPLGIPFSEVTEATLRRTFEVNVHGVTFGVKHGPRLMPETGGALLISHRLLESLVFR